MPFIQYEAKEFSEEKLQMIASSNQVINKYIKQGFSLTLRQLFYVFVSNDMFPDSWKYRNVGGDKWVRDSNGTKNASPNYKALGGIVSDARVAGLMDWDAIVDRSRSSYANQHWDRPSQVVESAWGSYAIDKWKNQPNYCECWVEKEALEQVLQRACQPLDVRFFACKGYASQSALWEAAQRLLVERDKGKEVHIIHLGDHDPSGIDMSRDIYDKLSLFTRGAVHIDRIALNMDQVEQYNPPPNPAKTTDSRYASYAEKFGEESWELDALPPPLLVELIKKAIDGYRDPKLWEEVLKEESKGKSTLGYICQYFPDVVKFLRERRNQDTSRVICQGCGATEANPKCLCKDSEGAPILLGEPT
jgi:hypothetical protein